MKTLENDIIKFWIEDGILYSVFKKPVEGTLENIKEGINLRHQISNNQKQYWCCDFKGIKPYKKDAAEYAQTYGQDFLYAAAGIVSSHLSYFFVRVFQKIKKTDLPFQIFKNKEDALIWLKEIKQKNELNGINNKV